MQPPSPPSPPPALPALVTPSPWDELRRYTDARIALGRAGHSLPTQAHLAFQLAHAQARDAVHLPFDADGVADAVRGLGLHTLQLHSAAPDRSTYLQRPDLGRRLDAASLDALAAWRHTEAQAAAGFDLAFVIADGLSALAIHQNAVPFIAATLARLRSDGVHRWQLAPVAVIGQGRVAVGDDAGHGLRARAVVVLIGERPGLSSPDSMGLYLTWSPRPGLRDDARNCISNVRPAGLAVDAAAAKLHQLLSQSRLRQLSGVGLKDEADDHLQPLAHQRSGAVGNFLLAPPPAA